MEEAGLEPKYFRLRKGNRNNEGLQKQSLETHFSFFPSAFFHSFLLFLPFSFLFLLFLSFFFFSSAPLRPPPPFHNGHKARAATVQLLYLHGRHISSCSSGENKCITQSLLRWRHFGNCE